MFKNYENVSIYEGCKEINKQFIYDVVNKTSTVMGKKLSKNQVEGLVKYVRSINPSLISNQPRNIIDQIAKNFSKQLKQTTPDVVDTHELMKKQMSMDTRQNDKYSFMSKRTVVKDKIEEYNNDDRSSLTPFYGGLKPRTQNIYLLLDSKYRNLSTDPSVFQWTVLPSSNTGQGTVNTLSDKIHNIINIQFNKFNLPYIGSADNVYRRISLLIEEFSSMSVLTHTGRYHMLFTTDVVNNSIELSPLVNDDGRFLFHTPINILNTITLTFRSPFSKIKFQKDRYSVSISSLNQTQSILVFDENHGVADSELIHLERFTTDTPIEDARTIDAVNKDNGYIVTFINNNQLRIDIDLSNVQIPPTLKIDCFIASRRLIIPVRMEYIS